MPRLISRFERRDPLRQPVLHQALLAVGLFVVAGCSIPLPEASLREDEPLEVTTHRLEAASGLHFSSEPVRDRVPEPELRELESKSPFSHPLVPLMDDLCLSLFRPDGIPVPPGAAKLKPPRYTHSMYDVETERIMLADEASWPGRRSDLNRNHAIALSLMAQHLDLSRKLDANRTREDREEALVATAEGASHAAVLGASLTPVIAFDASAGPIRQQHREITEWLFEDPDGAPAALLADPNLPTAQKFALERLLSMNQADRRRAILRTFGGARLLLEAMARITGGNLHLLYKDPPRSTEQILHPERYLDRDDPPLEIETGPRDGLLGLGYSLEATGSVGEYGLLQALLGALPYSDATSAAEGWGGDSLSIYSGSDDATPSLVWRMEFDNRLEAMEGTSALQRASIIRFQGTYLASVEGAQVLSGGTAAVSIQRQRSSVALVVGGNPAEHPRALVRLLAEKVKVSAPGRSGRQDVAFRLMRAIASPIFLDEPGRFDTSALIAYGFLLGHRIYPLGAATSLINLSSILYVGKYFPEDLDGLLFKVERSPYRTDTNVLLQLFRKYDNDESEVSRFWSPLLSYTSGTEYSELGFGYGSFFRKGSGAGREVFSITPLFSHSSDLDGSVESRGVFFDFLNWRNRQSRDKSFRILPRGLFMQVTNSQNPPGLDVGFFADNILFRSREVVQDAGYTEFSILQGWLFRMRHDRAAGRYEDTLASGLLLGFEGGPGWWSSGLVRIFGRSLIGGGSWYGDAYFDFFFMRFD